MEIWKRPCNTHFLSKKTEIVFVFNENFDFLSNIRKVVACQDREAVRIKKPVEINGSRMKYETKKKHQIYVETLAGKPTDKGESVTMNRRKIQSTAE